MPLWESAMLDSRTRLLLLLTTSMLFLTLNMVAVANGSAQHVYEFIERILYSR